MARTNTPVRSSQLRTHEGAISSRINPKEQLRRTLLACLLWERSFYEDGVSVAERIAASAGRCSPEFISGLAKEARNEYRLRHAPLWLVMSLLRRGGSTAGQTLTDVIQRPDEITEALAMYWRDGRIPLSKQLKVGLANAFNKFDEYQFAKYNRNSEIKLKDVLFMVHPKPKDADQQKIFDRIVKDDLAIPETWEVKLSSGQNKVEVFTDLIKRKKLGHMALLRNLRNMDGVDEDLINQSIIEGAKHSKVLPFRYLSAAKAAPRFEESLDIAMQSSMSEMPKLKGTTVLLVDVSLSMNNMLSDRSTLNRLDAAAALAVLVREISEDCVLFAFSHQLQDLPSRRGMSLIDAIRNTNRSNTRLGKSVTELHTFRKSEYDRVIIITDEQSRDQVPAPKGKGYILNVASYQNGIGYGTYTHITGWSEQSIRYIQEIESV